MTSTASRGVRAAGASTPVRPATAALAARTQPLLVQMLAPLPVRSPVRLVVVVLLALVVAVGLLPAAGPASARTAGAPDDAAVTAEIVALAPGVLTADDTLDVTLRVTNSTDTTLTSPAVFLGVDRRSLSTRSTLDGWVEAGVVGRTGYRVAEESLDPIEPGTTTDVELSVPAALLGITGGSDWGPRGIALVVTEQGSRVAAARTFVVAPPSGEVTPLGLGILAAVTGPPVDADPETYTATLSAATRDDGRLGRLLAATGTTPEVGWAVDPALVAAAGASPDPAVGVWAGELVAATADRTTFALPAYDPDLAAYARAGSDLPQGTPLPGDGTTPLDPDDPWRADLAWPADPVPDLRTTTLAAASGATTLVVGGDGLTPDEALTYTPSGLADVSTTAGDLTALVADPVITGLVAAGGDITSTQRLLAETAVVARERPAEQRYVLAALGRTWEPDVAAFTAQLAALDDAPWVTLTSVSDVLSAPVPDVARTALPDEAANDAAMSPAQLRALERSRTELADFASVTVEPSELTEPREPGFVSPTSVAFRADPEARRRAVQEAQRSTDAVLGSISLLPGSTITFVAEAESLPVRVSNDLEQDAEVQVVLRPDGQQLQVTQRPTATVPAGGETTVQVPVQGFGSGNVTVEVTLVSAADPSVQVAEPQEIGVRVRADWESVGTTVAAVLLVLALVAGIWRTIRRGRSPRRLAGATVDQPAPDPSGGAPDPAEVSDPSAEVPERSGEVPERSAEVPERSATPGEDDR